MKWIKGILKVLVLLIVVLIIGYFLGPVADRPDFITERKQIDFNLDQLDAYVQKKEAEAGPTKEDNQARIIWNDSVPTQTTYSIVYLHGFGASQGEGAPVHENLASAIGANLYLSRLAGHGLKAENAFEGLTPEKYMESAADALFIGEKLGEKVILVATSTGGAQALYLATQFPEKIAALVLYSPFIEMADPNLQRLSTGPWHEQIAGLMLEKGVSYTERPDSVAAYWSTYYHFDAYNSLFTMVKYSTTEDIIQEVNVPVFLAYYYQDKENQDDVVSVAAMKEMFENLAVEEKKAIAFPKTGNHVIASKWRSNDWPAVQDSTLQFLKEHLDLKN